MCRWARLTFKGTLTGCRNGFNKGKCRVLQQGWNSSLQQPRPGADQLAEEQLCWKWPGGPGGPETEREPAVLPGSKEGWLPTTLAQHVCSQQAEVIIHLYLVLVRLYLEHHVQFCASPVLKKSLTNWFSRHLHLDGWTLPKDTVLFLRVWKLPH